jgi:hypothetical protein
MPTKRPCCIRRFRLGGDGRPPVPSPTCLRVFAPSPYRLTCAEIQLIGDMVTSPEYRHVPTGTLAVLAQRLGTASASPSTWYRLVRQYGWRRSRVRVHPV